MYHHHSTLLFYVFSVIGCIYPKESARQDHIHLLEQQDQWLESTD